MRYDFDWDPNKERANIRKHGILFRQAASVFKDPNQLALFDEKHSDNEEGWITIGIDNTGILRVVAHIFRKIDENLGKFELSLLEKQTTKKFRSTTR